MIPLTQIFFRLGGEKLYDNRNICVANSTDANGSRCNGKQILHRFFRPTVR